MLTPSGHYKVEFTGAAAGCGRPDAGPWPGPVRAGVIGKFWLKTPGPPGSASRWSWSSTRSPRTGQALPG